MMRSGVRRLYGIALKWPVATAFGLFAFGTALSGIAGLVIEETSGLPPTPFVIVIGVATGVVAVKLLRDADRRKPVKRPR